MNWFKHVKNLMSTKFGFEFTDETTEAEFIEALNKDSATRMEETDSTIETLQTQLNDAEKTISTLNDTISSLQKDVKGLQDSLGGLVSSEALEEVKSQVAGVKDSVNKKVTKIESDIKELATEEATKRIGKAKKAGGGTAEISETQKKIQDQSGNAEGLSFEYKRSK